MSANVQAISPLWEVFPSRGAAAAEKKEGGGLDSFEVDLYYTQCFM